VLDFDINRPAPPPKDAATVVLVRDAGGSIEVFCVERSKQSRFLGGAIVFPGGKVDASDADDAWNALTTEPQTFARSFGVAACRETLEEAAILLATAPMSDADAFELRARLAKDPAALRDFLAARDVRLDLAKLHPLARWVTPEAESRRFDTRFFLAVAPEGQSGAHDEHETMASFWATPAETLRRWETGHVQVAPPTHNTLALLATCTTTAEAIALTKTRSLDPICPRLVPQNGTLALALPGDPEHDVSERRAFGGSRYVLRGDRWLLENV
jgi:8-oxo-dGTP pyrophosphatase MutT (NUDIX family)